MKLIGSAGAAGALVPPADASINRLLLEFYKSPNNGRQIATMNGGRRVLLVHSKLAGPCEIEIWLETRGGKQRLDGFQNLGQLVGPHAQIPAAGTAGFGACCVWHDDRLLVAWSAASGVAVASGRRQANRFEWSAAKTVLPGKYTLGDLSSWSAKQPMPAGRLAADGPVITYHRVHSRNEESCGILPLGVDRQRQEIRRGGPMFAPVAECDAEGRLHLCWHDLVGQVWYATIDRRGAEPDVQKIGLGRQPAMAITAQHVLVVCETPYGHLNWYALDRLAGQWRRNVPLTVTNKWLTSDQIHSPALSVDQHGVAWLFFADNTRRSTFQARWLGSGWSHITNGPRIYFRPPHFDFNLLPIGRLSVEKQPSGEVASLPAEPRPGGTSKQPAAPGLGLRTGSDIGLLLSCEPPVDRVAFRTAALGQLSTAAGHRTLFLDLQEIAYSENLELQVETAVKHAANPLLELGPVGSFDEDRVFNHGCVLHDDGLYRMWYGGIREPRQGEPRLPWYDWIHCGYAESKNGIDWQRVPVHQVEWKGSKHNNILPFFRHAPLLFRDSAEPDPQRRYKGFYFWNSAEHMEIARSGKYGRQYDPRDERFLMDLLTSPDGIRWKRQEGQVQFPGQQVRPLSAIPQSVFRDMAEPDPRKRFKAYGFMSLNVRRRGTCCLTSPDALNWTAHPEMPLIDPAVRGIPPAAGGPTGQVHDTVCFPYAGYYLALIQDQRDPLHMPVELAFSRDSETFHHVLPEQHLIPVGKLDAFDALTILPTQPVILDDEIRLYYGGGSEAMGRDGVRRWRALPGLATLRRDGFTSLSIRDTGTPGSLQTIPFELPQSGTLRVNANCPRGATLRVELADAGTGKPIPGFTVADCLPVEHDQLNAAVSWKSNNRLPAKATAAGHEGVVLRFQLHDRHGQAKFYSFWFE